MGREGRQRGHRLWKRHAAVDLTENTNQVRPAADNDGTAARLLLLLRAAKGRVGEWAVESSSTRPNADASGGRNR